ncbi:DUF1700 domain-containing protein [Sphingobacterium faecium]|uniref:HAAS signaling domain-containing protein n=1 Tax=Sphingobacterium faecium TaxID=34087 RepID=UPI00129162C7|nr:DUF1700 domain-containing protein [Sphingobacterium faecium]MQP28658.1 DUF1700 domain-containing protein [Sphingobacterium faecium]
MKFKEIAFKDTNSSRIYKDYLKRVSHAIHILDKENQQEILLEINSHIYEGTRQNFKDQNEVEHLLDVLEKLGQPEVFLKPMVADRKLKEATKTFNPIKIAKALMLNIGNGISYIIFSLLYLFLFAFVFLIIAKIINPEHIGLFYRANHIFVLGQYNNLQGVSYSEYEKLGDWFIPVILVFIIILYIILTLFLKLNKNLKNKSL